MIGKRIIEWHGVCIRSLQCALMGGGRSAGLFIRDCV